MTRTERLLLALIAVALLGLIGLFMHQRLQTAVQERARIEVWSSRIQDDLRQWQQLSAGRPTAPAQQVGDGDLITKAHQALNLAGLPAEAWVGISQRPRQQVPGSERQIASVIIRLQGLSPEEFGSWLHAWHSQDNGWELSEVSFSPSRSRASGRTASGPGQDTNRYDAVCTLIAALHDEDPEP